MITTIIMGKFLRNNWYVIFFIIGFTLFFLGLTNNLQRDGNVFAPFFIVGILLVIVGMIVALIKNKITV